MTDKRKALVVRFVEVLDTLHHLEADIDLAREAGELGSAEAAEALKGCREAESELYASRLRFKALP